MIEVSWQDLKPLIDSGTIDHRHIELDKKYIIRASDGQFSIGCTIYKNSPESAEYESSYKANGTFSKNIQASSPFASNKLPNGKQFFIRVHGIKTTVLNGTNNTDFVIPYDECKFSGLNIVNAELEDNINLKILDTAQGTYSGVPNSVLNQFGHEVYLSPEPFLYQSPYAADLLKDMIIRIEYVTANPSKIVYINIILHEVA